MNFELSIQCAALDISRDEILSRIGASKIAEIKKTDPNPEFVVYAAGQEGTWNPRIIGDSAKPIVWMRDAISKLSAMIQAGTKLFSGHNADNSTENRVSYGNVVSSFEKDINGKNTAIIIAYVDPAKKEFVSKQDIISVEASVSLIDRGAQYLADTVSRVSGLAIGSSDKWTPASPGAKQLSMIQAMDVNIQANETQTGETKKMTEQANPVFGFSDMQRFKDERKVFASQLYKAHEIVGQKVKMKDGKVIYQGGDRVLQDELNEYFQEGFKEQAAEILAENEALKKQLEEVGGKAKQYYNKVSKYEFIPEIKKVATEKKFTPKAIEILEDLLDESEIPEDEKQKEAFQEAILAKAAAKHEKYFKEAGQSDTTKVATPAASASEAAGANEFLQT